MVEAERIADGHHPVAGLHLFRVAEAGFRQRAAGLFGQLDQGAVGQRVAADHLRVELGAVVFTKNLHGDLGGVLDDMVVRQDEAGLVDDEAGAGAVGFLGLLRAAAALAGGAGGALPRGWPPWPSG